MSEVQQKYEKLKRMVCADYGEPTSDGDLSYGGEEYLSLLEKQGGVDREQSLQHCVETMWEHGATIAILTIQPWPFGLKFVNLNICSTGYASQLKRELCPVLRAGDLP